jgi:hypothetical protein
MASHDERVRRDEIKTPPVFAADGVVIALKVALEHTSLLVERQTWRRIIPLGFQGKPPMHSLARGGCRSRRRRGAGHGTVVAFKRHW